MRRDNSYHYHAALGRIALLFAAFSSVLSSHPRILFARSNSFHREKAPLSRRRFRFPNANFTRELFLSGILVPTNRAFETRSRIVRVVTLNVRDPRTYNYSEYVATMGPE